MNLHDACRSLAPLLGLSVDDLITFAEHDTIGGFHLDESKRRWYTGSIWEVEGQLVYALIRALKPRRVLEIGVGNGCTTTHILTALTDNGGGDLLSLDPTPYPTMHVDDSLHAHWTFVREDALGYLRAHPGEAFDLVVEDGPHGYEFTRDVLREALATGPRLILVHDAAHFLVGRDVSTGMQDALGESHTLLVEPSDCGWGYWVNPAPAKNLPVQTFNVAPPTIEVTPSHGEKVLYLPIIEPGAFHATALANKRGLYEALVDSGHPTIQLDYLALPPADLYGAVVDAIDRAGITLLLTQFHSAEHLTPAQLASLKAHKPTLRIVNWSGDSWLHSLTADPVLDLARHTDLWLVAAPDVLPIYEANGIRAAFWQIAYEQPVGNLPTMPAYDVVFLGNVISEKRRSLLEFLRTLDGVKVGIYGDWEHADGNCLYDFGAGEALYQNATLAIADNPYPDQTNYTSNRPIQALMAGGALLLHQHVPKMDTLLGIEPGRHFVEWQTTADLEKHIRTYLKKGNEPRRRKIVKAGQAFAREHHTYTERVRQLDAMLEALR